jgi:hypothetical protein
MNIIIDPYILDSQINPLTYHENLEQLCLSGRIHLRNYQTNYEYWKNLYENVNANIEEIKIDTPVHIRKKLKTIPDLVHNISFFEREMEYYKESISAHLIALKQKVNETTEGNLCNLRVGDMSGYRFSEGTTLVDYINNLIHAQKEYRHASELFEENTKELKAAVYDQQGKIESRLLPMNNLLPLNRICEDTCLFARYVNMKIFEYHYTRIKELVCRLLFDYKTLIKTLNRPCHPDLMV